MKICRHALTFLVSVPMIALGAHAQGHDWLIHRNDRFGFTLQYPADVFEVERTAESGEGQVFVARDSDARLLVGALLNTDGHSPASYRDFIARESYRDFQLGYRRLGRSWFVLSGLGKGKVFYEKVMFNCGGRLINSFAMIYPIDRRNVFDPIVEHIEDTFRPGTKCGAVAGSATPYVEPRPLLRDVRRVPRPQPAIIVLRSLNPPYHYRYLRSHTPSRYRIGDRIRLPVR